MAGVILLLMAILTGYILTSSFFNGLFEKSPGVFQIGGENARLSRYMILLPVSVLAGLLIFSWTSYIFSLIFYRSGTPLLYGNILTAITLAVVCILGYKQVTGSSSRGDKSIKKLPVFTIVTVTVITVFWSFFMYRSFHISDSTVKVGHSVFSDFAPHLAVIRSFSLGSNFPTEYPHFADGTIRYHFLFQFMCGNLEFLGLRLDHAFNIPSILSMVSFLMLLYSFAVILTGKRWAGVITIILFHFRSSFAFFTCMDRFKKPDGFLSALLANNEHLGKTLHEEWGLWAQKVYVNQRHLSLGIGILLISLIIMLPYLYSMLKTVRGTSFRALISELVLRRDAWLPDNPVPSIFAGLLLGFTGFFNGAAVISALCLLFVMAILSKQRLAYLNTAFIAVTLVMMQTLFFTGGATTFKPRFTVGFLSGSRNLLGMAQFVIELLGILPFVLLACLLLYPWRFRKYIMFLFPFASLCSMLFLFPQFEFIYRIITIAVLVASFCAALFYRLTNFPRGTPALLAIFSAPVAAAFLLQVTPDITVNHKYVIIGVTLLDIIAASYLFGLLSSHKPVAVVTAVLLTALLTITGVADITALYNLDRNYVHIDMNDSLTTWARNNTGSNEVFLTPQYSLHPLLMAGRKIFYGWPYYAWSAGYDTSYRASITRSIYSAQDSERLVSLVREHNISYIIVENDNRNSNEYQLNETLIEDTFKQVYSKGDYKIFRTY